MDLSEDFIIHYAGNPNTVSNGRALSGKGVFLLHETEDGGLLFGTCKGSGSSIYSCSVDFSDPAKPTSRCTCPSRQNPCKHAVALLFHKLNGDNFTIEPLPDDVAMKREKKSAREAKSAAGPAPAIMTKAKAIAAAKKCRVQLDGIAMAEKILSNIIRVGLHSMDRDNFNLYASQVKELGNYYIGGVQSSFQALLNEALEGQLSQSFTNSVEQTNYIYSLLKRGKQYTESKLSDFEAFPETPGAALDLMLHSAIEEQLGYAWKLTELRDKGLYVHDARLLQLSYDSYVDRANKQLVDEGVWMILNTGAIVYTYNYRPYKALKNINPDDSFFMVMETEDLYIYPGAKNPRVRWEKESMSEACPDDFNKVISYARSDFAQVIKEVKSQIISPLADKHPIFALRSNGLFHSGEANVLYIADASGSRITLRLEKFGYLLDLASQHQIEDGALTCRFTYDSADDLLYAVPLSLITEQGIIRLFY